MNKQKPYRAIPIDGKDFVYGWYIEKEDSHSNTYSVIVFGRDFEVIPKTVGQSTGRADKNGFEIYGDDICKIKLRDGNERIGIVEWVDKDCGYHLQVFKATDGETGSHCVSYSGSAVEGIYIIGNKHQHPELLENSK